MGNIVFLYGAPASGKTTLGKRLAAALKTSFIDLDAVIVDRAGKSIPEIFASEGEEGFRNRESETLALVVASSSEAVIALGGGTLLRDANRALCEEKGVVWCLDAPSDEELARRIGTAPGSRPLGNRARERAPHYASFPNRVAAFFEAGDSLVVVGKSIAAAVLPRYPVVADSTVAKLYEQMFSDSSEIGRDRTPGDPRRGRSPRPTVIPSGEEHKTIETVCGLWKEFAAKGLGRKDVVCALGGGVTGDLTGFAAATWMRGIDWVNVPTTLLAMVDASTGGKTGCDLPEGKNLAGAFHAPRLVVIDTDFLKTLPPAILASGRAEMVKHEVIGGMGLRRGQETAAPVGSSASTGDAASSPLPSAKDVAANLMVKVGIVREDPYETKGRRLLLNCGHTVAHAVEKLSDYKISHGEAVAIGCVEEARLAVRLGLAKREWPDELAAVFAAAKLPTALPEGMDFEMMKPVMRGDKKRAGDVVTFALPCGWGDVRAVPVDLAAK